MMMRRVVIEPEAERELVAARAWYDEQHQGLGLAFINTADRAVMRAATMPSASSPVPGVAVELGARRIFLKRFPYAVVFVDLGEELSIVAFAHLRRRPNYWVSRIRPPG